MNSLIILQSECVDGSCAVLTGRRAQYAFETHGLRAGQRIKVGIFGGLRGEGDVTECSEERVVINLLVNMEALPARPVDLIVGVSRPQTVKKVIQAAVMLGVQSLHFVRSERGEKSYLQSTALLPDHIEEETVKALEQVWDTRAPQVSVHRTFDYFCKNRLQSIGASAASLRIVADPHGQPLRSVAQLHSTKSTAAGVVVAIGPERGWSDSEVDAFRRASFHVVGLGERVLRVELALTFLLGQLDVALPQG